MDTMAVALSRAGVNRGNVPRPIKRVCFGCGERGNDRAKGDGTPWLHQEVKFGQKWRDKVFCDEGCVSDVIKAGWVVQGREQDRVNKQ